MNRRRFAILAVAILALNAALWLAQGGLGGIAANGIGALFGPKMVRAEVVLKDAAGVHVYRVDRGRIVTVAPATRSLTIRERDDTIVTVSVAPTARITVAGANAPFTALRRRMFVELVREADGPAVIATATG
jgi:hypothetical protein